MSAPATAPAGPRPKTPDECAERIVDVLKRRGVLVPTTETVADVLVEVVRYTAARDELWESVVRNEREAQRADRSATRAKSRAGRVGAEDRACRHRAAGRRAIEILGVRL